MHINKLAVLLVLAVCLTGCNKVTYEEQKQELKEIDNITGVSLAYRNIEIPEFNYKDIKSYLCGASKLYSRSISDLQKITILLESDNKIPNNNYMLYLDKDGDKKLLALVNESGKIEKFKDTQLEYSFIVSNSSNYAVIDIKANIEDLDNIYWADGTKLNIEKDFSIAKEHLINLGYCIANEYNDIGGEYFIEIDPYFNNNLVTRQRSFILSSKFSIPNEVEFLDKDEQTINFEGLAGIESIDYDNFKDFHIITITFKNEPLIVPSTEEEFKDWLINTANIHYIKWRIEDTEYKAPILGVLIHKDSKE